MEIEPLPQEMRERTILSGPGGGNPQLPAWFRARQHEAWARFVSLPMPNRKDQAWRFSNVGALDLAPFIVGNSIDTIDSQQILQRSTSLDEVAGRLIYADDHLLRRDPLPDALRELGVILKPLERGAARARRAFPKTFHGAAGRARLREVRRAP